MGGTLAIRSIGLTPSSSHLSVWLERPSPSPSPEVDLRSFGNAAPDFPGAPVVGMTSVDSALDESVLMWHGGQTTLPPTVLKVAVGGVAVAANTADDPATRIGPRLSARPSASPANRVPCEEDMVRGARKRKDDESCPKGRRKRPGLT